MGGNGKDTSWEREEMRMASHSQTPLYSVGIKTLTWRVHDNQRNTSSNAITQSASVLLIYSGIVVNKKYVL